VGKVIFWFAMGLAQGRLARQNGLMVMESNRVDVLGMGLAQGHEARQNGLMAMESKRVEVLKREKKYGF
jgi:hypothetical protein